MYAYCNNNPVMYGDPSGTRMCCCVNVSDGGGKPIRDITNELNELMEDHVNELEEYKYQMIEQHNKSYMMTGGVPFFPNNSGVLAYGAVMGFFADKELGEWNLKEGDQYSKHDHFYYNGRLVSGEDVGNIHYGYVGASQFSDALLFFAAGLNQGYRDFHLAYLPYWFDEPRDYEMTGYGISLYRGTH